MILICEECGKKYRTIGTLKKDKVRFICRSCSHVITITKADVSSDNQDEAMASDFQSVLLTEPQEEISAETGMEAESGDPMNQETDEPASDKDMPLTASMETAVDVPSQGGMGLRTKMMLLFLVVPVALFAAAGIYYLVQMNKFSDTLTSESTQVVNKLAEDNIKEIARLVASQCKQYLMAHPELSKEQFMDNPELAKIATQRVGLTGYAALYSGGPFTTWAHPNRKILGKPLAPILRKPLGNEFDRFLEIIKDIEKGDNVENSGYYLWADQDGVMREKFMAVTPLEGTKFGVAATVYLDEFTRDIKKVENKANKNTRAVRNVILTTLGITLLIMAIIVFFYAHRITERIQNLTDVAERISVGEMDAEINIETNDEIGTLGEAIGRMQESIRLSIERLRRRR